ncbi:paraneoplastic antigen Ma1-like [Polypterus senegalus]|uniref:paraneoplastic antigen Ma1-like n=1 Tax=Polypterus senegalus TaxID=55291 RepID=UPI0019663A26|nr:paraneoplastic antigen Ma1-like [Polypterus senegalus]
MDVYEIIAWCKEKNVALENAVVLSNVPLDITDTVIYRVLDTVKGTGKTKVHGRCSDKTGREQFVLVETSKRVSEISFPVLIGIPDEIGPWSTQVLSATSPSSGSSKGEEFHTKLMSFLKQEGKSLADIQNVASPALTLNTELVSAINSLVQKCQTASPVEAQNYRKLRTFSGLTPTPNGEEDYEVWAEHTTHILEEWQCSDNVKKQRLVECLRGPAADIVRFVKVENPSATSCDYLKALDTAFGPTENASDLMVKFRNTFQEKGEKLSVYIIKLDKLLHSVLRKGGLKSSELNRLRIEQIIEGSSR